MSQILGFNFYHFLKQWLAKGKEGMRKIKKIEDILKIKKSFLDKGKSIFVTLLRATNC